MKSSQYLPALSSNFDDSRSTTGLTSSKKQVIMPQSIDGVAYSQQHDDNLRAISISDEAKEQRLRLNNRHIMKSLLDIHLAKSIIDKTQYNKPQTCKPRRRFSNRTKLRMQAERLVSQIIKSDIEEKTKPTWVRPSKLNPEHKRNSKSITSQRYDLVSRQMVSARNLNIDSSDEIRVLQQQTAFKTQTAPFHNRI